MQVKSNFTLKRIYKKKNVIIKPLSTCYKILVHNYYLRITIQFISAFFAKKIVLFIY